MKPRHSTLQVSLLFACSLFTTCAAAEYRQHGAHVHGVAHLDVVLDANTLEIDLDSPAVNLLGFEHAPHTPAEKRTLAQVASQLRNAGTLFHLPQAARCQGEKVNLESPLLDHPGKASHEHADMEASYRFSCTHPAELDTITVNLFRLFPGTHKLEVQLITPLAQRAAELTADSPRLQL